MNASLRASRRRDRAVREHVDAIMRHVGYLTPLAEKHGSSAIAYFDGLLVMATARLRQGGADAAKDLRSAYAVLQAQQRSVERVRRGNVVDLATARARKGGPR